MCFSATASFSASLFLLLVGLYALKFIKNKNQLPFASIPLFLVHNNFLKVSSGQQKIIQFIILEFMGFYFLRLLFGHSGYHYRYFL